MCASNLLLRFSAPRPVLLTQTLLVCGCRILIAEPGDERLVANSNQTPAGWFGRPINDPAGSRDGRIKEVP